ncbi:MAG: class I SAM-dependent methyltransferase [Haliangiales bacterium]
MSEQPINEEKAEAFANQLLEVLNHGSLTLMISIGHRTGLFDAMAKLGEPATSEELATAAGLNERYVREWASTMLIGGIVTYDPESKKFTLPAEHAAFLTRDSVPNNMAAFAQYIPLLGNVEEDIIECFKNGGGVPYSKFTRFQTIMAEDSAQTVLPALIDVILPLAPGLPDRLSAGIDVLDVGCGSGRALNLMARTYPNSRFVGYDMSEEGVAAGTAEAAKHGTTNIRFEARDATDLGAANSFDLVTSFDAIHDQVYPDKVLAQIDSVLRPDGVYLMQDIRSSSNIHENVDHPLGTLLYTLSCMHCMTVSLSGGGPGLGTMWGDQLAKKMLKAAGFTNIATHQLEHDFQNNYYVCTR